MDIAAFLQRGGQVGARGLQCRGEAKAQAGQHGHSQREHQGAPVGVQVEGYRNGEWHPQLRKQVHKPDAKYEGRHGGARGH